MAKTTLKFHLQKIKGKPLEAWEHGKSLYKEFDDQAPPGCYDVEIKRAVKHKTHKQVKTIFGLMIKETIIQANDLGIDVSYLMKYLLSDYDPKGQGLTVDFLHELMYVICPTTDDEGRRVTLSKMNTIQASNLFERYRNIMAGIGIVISDPKGSE